jgi:predicted transcriptional regulator of viral defense system
LNNLPIGKRKLSRVLRQAGDLIRVDDVVSTLQIERGEANQLLSRWTKQGSLKRISRGLYAVSPIQSVESEHVLTDPWVIVPNLFSPCYVGGRTAAEHWDLTEQIFKDVVVFPTEPVRSKHQFIHGTNFTLKKISQQQFFGTTSVWRSRTKVLISDEHKTILDILEYPAIGGGIQHVSDCLQAYFASDQGDSRKLFEYALKRGNGAVFKRLGFLVDRLALDPMLAEACRARISAGLAKLDPSIDSPRISTRWRLRIPDSWAKLHD